MHPRTRPRTATTARNAPRYQHWSAPLLPARRVIRLQHPATLAILFLCLPRNAYCSTMEFRYPRGIKNTLQNEEYAIMRRWVQDTPSPGIDDQLPVEPAAPPPSDSSLRQKGTECLGTFLCLRLHIFSPANTPCVCVSSRSVDALSISPGTRRGAASCLYIVSKYVS